MNAGDGTTANNHCGFTLIELVIVISIIGILAAMALPRYVNLQRDARMAKAQAIHGSIKAAAMLAKVRCDLDLATGVTGQCTQTAGQVLMEGVNIPMVNRYPAATQSGIDTAAQVFATDGVIISGTNPRIFQLVGAGALQNCQVSYSEAPAPGMPPVTVIDLSDC